MSKPVTSSKRSPDPEIRALARDIVAAADPRIVRVVAAVDALINRGTADALIAPLRQRLLTLRPPRPLRFARLMFHPLGPLIVPPTHWRPGQSGIPRTALMPMAEHVRTALPVEAHAIEEEIAGRTNADTELIARLGRRLWPAAARVLAGSDVPRRWATTSLADGAYRPLADSVAALLGQAMPLDALCTETANGLLPPRPEAIAAMLAAVIAASPPTLPMLIALLMFRLPQAAATIRPEQPSPQAATIHAAMSEATDRLLRQLDEDEGIEVQIGSDSLADAGAAAGRTVALLEQFDQGASDPRRRQQLWAIRHKLDACCQARFASGLQQALLTPLLHVGTLPDPGAIAGIEAAARGLRVLEIEARAVGSGPTYDLMLRKAVEAIQGDSMRDRLTLVDQLRLVEILVGPDAALAMLEGRS